MERVSLRPETLLSTTSMISAFKNSKTSSRKSKVQTIFTIFVNRTMKEQILKLRSEGKSYRQIKKLIGCSKGTISYHCGESQKEKYQIRQRNNRKISKTRIRKKLDIFARLKISDFRTSNDGSKNISRFDYDSAYKKLHDSPVCYLTGRPIDLTNTRSYELDHIIPRSKGGTCDLNNMGLACRDANRAKADMLSEEFLQLCTEVLTHAGYIVTPSS